MLKRFWIRGQFRTWYAKALCKNLHLWEPCSVKNPLLTFHLEESTVSDKLIAKWRDQKLRFLITNNCSDIPNTWLHFHESSFLYQSYDLESNNIQSVWNTFWFREKKIHFILHFDGLFFLISCSRFYLCGLWRIKHLCGNTSAGGIAATESPGDSWIRKSFNIRPRWETQQLKKKKKAKSLNHIQTPLKTEFLFQSQHRSGSGKAFKIPPSSEEKDAASSQ